MSTEIVKIQKKCQICGTTKIFELSRTSWYKWKEGMLIQQAFPNLSADDRELLISDICGHCFDKLFH